MIFELSVLLEKLDEKIKKSCKQQLEPLIKSQSDPKPIYC